MANTGKPVQAEATRPTLALIDVDAVASLLSCSARHVYRLSEAGHMPAPVRLGTLVRWNRAELETWLVAGCPPVNRAPSSTTQNDHEGGAR